MAKEQVKTPTGEGPLPSGVTHAETSDRFDPKTGRLTREGAIKAVRAGESVMLNGKTYSKEDDLPGEAEFAKGDEAAEAAARDNLLRHRKAIDEQLASLGGKAKGGGEK